jgi:hypothetical protein
MMKSSINFVEQKTLFYLNKISVRRFPEKKIPACTELAEVLPLLSKATANLAFDNKGNGIIFY